MVKLVDKGLYWISYKGRTIIGRYFDELVAKGKAGFEAQGGYLCELKDVKGYSTCDCERT